MWTIPAADIKRLKTQKINGRLHLTLLAKQALVVLWDLHPITDHGEHHGEHVFPSLLTGECPMSENIVSTALRRMVFTTTEMTVHGFGAMARTLMVEGMDVSPDVIEAQLAHHKSGPLGAAYDRAQFVMQRCAMMQLWADHLEALREDGKVRLLRAA